MTSSREKIQRVYDFVDDNLYFCRKDMVLGADAYNSALLFSVLTECIKGRELIFGVYGRGKTSIAEYLHSVFYQLPLMLVRKVCIRGDSQLTAEKIKGRPDYGKLNQGIEAVVWQHFVLVQPKIMDEFNRIPESTQNIVLNGLARGEWEYLNDFVAQGRHPFFGTCNYPDRGNNPVVEGILDRFDIAVESKFPGVVNAWLISDDYYDEKELVLHDGVTYAEMVGLLNANKPYAEFIEVLKGLQARFGKVLRDRDVPTLDEGELDVVRQEMNKLQFSQNAKMYAQVIMAEMNVSSKFGERRRCDPDDDETGLYMGNFVALGNSSRTDKAMKKYAQALAWFRGHKEVTLEDVEAVAPYTLWHKIELKEKTKGVFYDADRGDHEKLYAMKSLLGQGKGDDFPGVKKRFVEIKSTFEKIMGLVNKNEHGQAKTLCEAAANNKKGHPIFVDVLYDLT